MGRLSGFRMQSAAMSVGNGRPSPAARRYQLIMLAILAVMSLVLDSVFMQFHAADDEDHFGIAYAASHFRFGPVPSPDPALSSGSYVDAALPGVVQRNFEAVRLAAKPVRTSTAWTGRQIYMPLPATVYLPLAYTPQMIAIRLGEAAGLTVETTIHMARVANGLTALAIIAAALAFMPETIGLFVLVLLALPKSLQVFASNSADPMIHAITIALVAFFCRAAIADWKPKSWHYAAAGLGCLVLGGVRPPLAALGLLPLYVAVRRRNPVGMAMAGVAMVLAVGWWAYVMPFLYDTRCQAAGTLGDKVGMFASHGVQMFAETLSTRGFYYWAGFIGEIGYGDARTGYFRSLPLWTYGFASVTLVLGLASLGARELRMATTEKVVPAAVALIVVIGIFFALSVGCTIYGSRIIEGVQGRYFVTPLLLLTIPAAALLPPSDGIGKLLRYALPVFLVANFAMMTAIGIQLYAR